MLIDHNAPHAPPTELEQLRRAIASEQAGLAGCEEDLKQAPKNADLLNEQEQTLARIAEFKKTLAALESRALRAVRDRTAGQAAQIQRLSELALRAKQGAQRRSVKAAAAMEKLEALAADLSELHAIDVEASAAYAAAVMPMVGVERFTRSPALQIGALPLPLFDAISKALEAHAHDAQTPLESARQHSDRVADTLDAEMERQTTTDEEAPQ
ncbi:hypothetical protein ACIPRI_14685 [Variovorax sp. LARHSF232]